MQTFINTNIADDDSVRYGDSGDDSITARRLAAEQAAIIHAGGNLSLWAAQRTHSCGEIRKEETGLVSAIGSASVWKRG
ncbi:hypothetical protein [Thalassospira lohafexi]|uniref:Uncharacterized protein n=1 Tax=Thalassospira lohafexi TaxID=744227 RepID=A0A2N3L4L3_9PROT|nr:hypothetical protein [Thalassospira lohafexi]PKR57773.1 hypothetical protein COO92_13450 [Thalassospira lohafexi]